MTYKSVALNSFTPVSTPTIVNDVEIDGYVDGQPVCLRTMRDGMVMPAIGTVVSTQYATGIVVGYTEDMLVVDMVEFNEDFEFETKDPENPDILDVYEYVAGLSRCYRASIACKRETFTRLYKSEITGVLSDTNQKLLDSAYPMPDSDTTVCIGFVGDMHKWLEPTDHIVVKFVPLQARETRKERQARQARERALAEKMANAMLDDLDDTEVPEDVMAEIADAFGE